MNTELDKVNILSVSGGKDSTAMYLLALERGIEFRAVFADTGNEHEITLNYIRELPGKTGGPPIEWVKADFSDDFARKSRYIRKVWPSDGVSPEKVEQAAQAMFPTDSLFLDCCKMHGLFPGNEKMKFCTQDLKIEPVSEYHEKFLQAGHEVISWVGVRAEESAKRAKLSEIEKILGCNLTIYRPLLHWPLADVVAIHTRHNLELNPLYQMGMSRVGCMPCINSTKGELRQIAKLFPDRIARVAEFERQVQLTMKSDTTACFFRVDKTPRGRKSGDPRLATIDHVIRWAKTGPGGDVRQLTLDLGDDHQCLSAMGACE